MVRCLVARPLSGDMNTCTYLLHVPLSHNWKSTHVRVDLQRCWTHIPLLLETHAEEVCSQILSVVHVLYKSQYCYIKCNHSMDYVALNWREQQRKHVHYDSRSVCLLCKCGFFFFLVERVCKLLKLALVLWSGSLLGDWVEKLVLPFVYKMLSFLFFLLSLLSLSLSVCPSVCLSLPLKRFSWNTTTRTG